MNNHASEMISIIVIDQPTTFDICSWWAHPVLAEMTQEEDERLGEPVHDFCLELRPILARMQQKPISQNMPLRKQMPN